VLRVTRQVFFGEIRNQEFWHLPKLTWQEYLAGAILAPLIFIVGFFPGVIHPMIDSSLRPVEQRLIQAERTLAIVGNPIFGDNPSLEVQDGQR
jgi:NADH:ubiquinone oxidoreductase subunit 4 (subunit M)